MAEKPLKKTVAIKISRERVGVPKVMVAIGFKLRADKASGLVEIFLEAAGHRGEKVVFDPVVTLSNLSELKRYAVNLDVHAGDAALRDDVASGDGSVFANMIHFSQMGGRAETIFGMFNLADWVGATRQSKTDIGEIKSYDILVAMSTTAFQKKLLLELLSILSQKEEE